MGRRSAASTPPTSGPRPRCWAAAPWCPSGILTRTSSTRCSTQSATRAGRWSSTCCNRFRTAAPASSSSGEIAWRWATWANPRRPPRSFSTSRRSCHGLCEPPRHGRCTRRVTWCCDGRRTRPASSWAAWTFRSRCTACASSARKCPPWSRRIRVSTMPLSQNSKALSAQRSSPTWCRPPAPSGCRRQRRLISICRPSWRATRRWRRTWRRRTCFPLCILRSTS
mmetsp:Transcript_54821/g.157645  ORF Transcript_54821/g.157645 Transcript_54821/m.157645 type:complete len:224 (+) Transcript_54821:539-1210(+)